MVMHSCPTISYPGILLQAPSAVEVSDANGCISQLLLPSLMPWAGNIIANLTRATCGLSNGSVTLGAVTGGLAPYTYSFDGSAFTSTTNYTNLAAGLYAVEVMDANGCIFATSANITNASGPTAIVTNVTSASCGASNGTVTLGTVTGGLAP